MNDATWICGESYEMNAITLIKIFPRCFFSDNMCNPGNCEKLDNGMCSKCGDKCIGYDTCMQWMGT